MAKAIRYITGVTALTIALLVFGTFGDKYINFSVPQPVETGGLAESGRIDDGAALLEEDQQIFAAFATEADPFAGMSYQEVVEKYEGKRIQFGEQCQSIPSYLTFKTGTELMLDNRSSEKRVVYLDAEGYTIAAYGWGVIPLTTRDLPHTISIDCAGLYNSGQVFLQN